MERCVEYHQTNLSYLFDLDKYGKDYDNYTIDSMDCGNVARFINHSCNPNLSVFAVASERRDREVYDIALFTNRFIPAGTELTFSYTLPNSKKMSRKIGRSVGSSANVDNDDGNDEDEDDSEEDDGDDTDDSISGTAGDESSEERVEKKNTIRKAVAAARLAKGTKSDKWRCHCGAKRCVGYLWT